MAYLPLTQCNDLDPTSDWIVGQPDPAEIATGDEPAT
jgi:hypothetical protein